MKRQRLKELLECQRIRHQIAYRLRRYGYCFEEGTITPLNREQRYAPPLTLWYKP